MGRILTVVPVARLIIFDPRWRRMVDVWIATRRQGGPEVSWRKFVKPEAPGVQTHEISREGWQQVSSIKARTTRQCGRSCSATKDLSRAREVGRDGERSSQGGGSNRRWHQPSFLGAYCWCDDVISVGGFSGNLTEGESML